MDTSEPRHGVVRRVMVLYVGGTIGMTHDSNLCLVPERDVFRELLRQTSQLCDKAYVDGASSFIGRNALALPLFSERYRIVYEIKEFDPLLDSSNMGAEEWKKIALMIKEQYFEYDGFVVAHGTDTLVYTASALSFMFQNLKKTIVITGAQLPIKHPRSDGIHNLQHSIIFAGAYYIPEVCVFFGKALLRGNRTIKMSSESFDGFESPNYDPLAVVGGEIILKLHTCPSLSNRECILHADLNTNISILVVFPDISEKSFRSAFEPPTEGVVLLTYGRGNLPSTKDFIGETLREAREREIVVVNCSQCIRGSVKAIYETQNVLNDNGVISALDMTMEATCTKLMYVLSMKDLSYHAKKEMMESDLRGEMTVI